MSRLKTDAIRNVNASVDGITLDTSGNVAIPNKIGINTTSPEDLLHIKTGKIRIENAIVHSVGNRISKDADICINCMSCVGVNRCWCATNCSATPIHV